MNVHAWSANQQGSDAGLLRLVMASRQDYPPRKPEASCYPTIRQAVGRTAALRATISKIAALLNSHHYECHVVPLRLAIRETDTSSRMHSMICCDVAPLQERSTEVCGGKNACCIRTALYKSSSQRDVGLIFVKIDPLLKSLRQDSRYTDLLRKMRLPA